MRVQYCWRWFISPVCLFLFGKDGFCEKSVGLPTTHSHTARVRSRPGSRPLSGGWKSGRCSLPTVALLPVLVFQRPPGNREQSLPLHSAFNKTHPFPVALLCSSASAAPEFEGRGGDDLGTEIANTLYRIFNNKSSVDLESLCISPREHCWALYVDVLVGLRRCPGHAPRPGGPVGLLSSLCLFRLQLDAFSSQGESTWGNTGLLYWFLTYIQHTCVGHG